MVPYFPSPHSDELWYSVLCRSYIYSGMTTVSRFVDVCFQTNHYSILNPFNVNQSISLFIQHNPNYPYLPQTIVEYHTLFPFYSRFFSRQKKDRFIEGCKRRGCKYAPSKMFKQHNHTKIKILSRMRHKRPQDLRRSVLAYHSSNSRSNLLPRT